MAIFRDLRVYLREGWRLKKAAPGAYQRAELRQMFARWRRFVVKGGSPTADMQPWMTFGAIDFLDQHLQADMRVFEYGSGGSTLFFLKRAAQVVTIEHDPAWAAQIQSVIEAKNFSNAQLRLIQPEEDSSSQGKDSSDPRNYVSQSPEFGSHSFRKYASSIDEFPNDHFNAVVIDGRVRPSCCLHGKSKVAKGGWLVLDNAERSHYHFVHETLDNSHWKKHDFYGPGPYLSGFWQTCVWQRVS